MTSLKRFLFLVLSLPLIFATKAVAVPIHYSIDHDPISHITSITNFSDSEGSLRTFSVIADPFEEGGAYNPIFISPGSTIEYVDEATFQTTGTWWTFLTGSKGDKISTKNNKEPPTKIWNGKGGTNDARWWYLLPGKNQAWKQGPNESLSEDLPISTWVYIEASSAVGFVDTKPENNFETTATKNTLFHLGKEGKDNPKDKPNPPNTNIDWTYLLNIDSPFPADQAQLLLAEGTITVPKTDSEAILSVYTEVAGVGCIPEPETLALLVLGLALISLIQKNNQPSE